MGHRAVQSHTKDIEQWICTGYWGTNILLLTRQHQGFGTSLVLQG